MFCGRKCDWELAREIERERARKEGWMEKFMLNEKYGKCYKANTKTDHSFL